MHIAQRRSALGRVRPMPAQNGPLDGCITLQGGAHNKTLHWMW